MGSQGRGSSEKIGSLRSNLENELREKILDALPVLMN